MSMKKYGDLCFSSGEYKDENGDTKKRWVKHGVVMVDPESKRMSIYIPLFDKWFSIFPKQEQQQAPQQYQQQAPQQYQQQPPPQNEPELPF